ncbi:hypothetical protein MKL01_13550 [Methylobacterium sp. J-070]|nr:hypothetical protein [Methylobacterium sp. J-070]
MLVEPGSRRIVEVIE